MKKLIAVLIFVSVSISSHAQLQHLWSHDIGGAFLNCIYHEYAVDKSGNTIFGLWTGDTVPLDVDPDTGVFLLQPINNSLLFVAKYDTNGKFVFAKDFLNPQYDLFHIYEVETDAYNNIYIFGDFHGTIDLDPDTTTFLLTNNNYDGNYICKLDSNGKFITAKKITNGNPFSIDKVFFDRNDNLFIAGEILAGSFNTGTCSFTGDGTAYFAKFDLNLNCISVTPLYHIVPSGYQCYVFAICVDSLKNIYVTGNSEIDFDVDPSINVFTLHPGFFLAKFDSLNNLLIAKSTNDGWDDCITDMRINQNNELNVVGYYNDVLDFDFNPLSMNSHQSFGGRDIFYGKYDDQFNLIKMNDFHGPYGDFAYGFVEGESSDLYVIASFADTLYPQSSLGFAGIKSIGLGDALLFKASTDGTVQFAKSLGSIDGQIRSCKIYKKDNSIFLGGYFSKTADLDFSNGIASHSTQSQCRVFFAKYSLNDLTNKISGNVFIDYNNNGNRDSIDIPLQNVILKIEPGSFYVSSQPDGSYYCFVDTGTYTVSIPNPPIYYQNINPVQQVITFAGTSQIDTANNFGFNPAENINDLQVTLTNLQPTRPGFPVDFIIDYKNKGTVPIPSIIQLNYDTGLNFVSASPSFDSLIQQTLFWNLDTLMPLQLGQITVHFNVAASLGDSLYSIALINPVVNDATPLNNIDTLKNLVTGSFDPNDKSVDKEVVSVQQLQDTVFLTYLIRFQNTGTDTAFTVNIIDSIRYKLVLSTFELLSTSHACTYNLENNCMLFTFKNTNLPDSNINEAASHGFVKYKVKARKNLIGGDIIRNKAYIYFDYNEPVKTNTAITTVISPTGFSNFNFDNSVQLIPNPFSKNAQLIFDNALHQTFELKIFDVTGRIIFKTSTTSNRFNIERRNMDAGIYIYQLVNSITKQSFNGKMIVE